MVTAKSSHQTTRVCPRCKGSGRSLSLGRCHRCDGRELVEIGTDAASTARYEAEMALPFGEALPADWDPAAAAHAIEQGFRGLLGCAPAHHTESAYVLTCCGDEIARGTFAEMCDALQRHPQCCRFCTPRVARPYYADDGNIDGLSEEEREDADAADMRRASPSDMPEDSPRNSDNDLREEEGI
jgi:hypothetical protein